MQHNRQRILEPKSAPVLGRVAFARRMLCWLSITLGLLGVSLAVGMAGYKYTEDMDWIDAFLNAAMILGGMGEVDALHTPAGKVFAGCYALYAGVLLVVCGGLLLVPVFHRVLHRFHADR